MTDKEQIRTWLNSLREHDYKLYTLVLMTILEEIQRELGK